MADSRDELALLEARVAQGRYEEALAGVQETRFEDNACDVLLVRARALAGLGRFREALDDFARIGKTCSDNRMISARALFEMAVIVAGKSRNAPESVPLFRKVAVLFPEEPAARRAVVWLKEILVRHGGPNEALAELRALYREVGGTDLGALILFEAAQILGASRGVDEDVILRRLALYSLILERHGQTNFADDAAIEAARLCLRLGYPMVAAKLAGKVLEKREVSWFIGSYDTWVYPEAAWIRARALEAAGDLGGAARAYIWFAEEFPGERRGEAALIRACALFRKLGMDDAAKEVSRRVDRARGGRVGGVP